MTQKAKCVKNEVLKWDKEYDLSELVCTKGVAGDVLETDEPCGNKKGVLKQIGHKLEGNFEYLFEVCYDMNNGGALYSDHIIYGAAIASKRQKQLHLDTTFKLKCLVHFFYLISFFYLLDAKSVSQRPGFKNPGLAAGVNADQAYKQAEQKKTFTQLLGEDLANDYINTKSFLARGHLSPDGDMVYVSSSFSTYFYINTVPQWQAVNNGNWKSLEFAVRNTAANLKKNLRVLTGGHEVLQLEDNKHKLKSIYLVEGNKLPVPKFSWKVVQDTTTKKTISFVTLNNPFIEEVNDDDFLCEDICERTGWGQSSWSSKPNRGITYCCDVKELMKVIKTIPDVKSSGILEAKNEVLFKHLME